MKFQQTTGTIRALYSLSGGLTNLRYETYTYQWQLKKRLNPFSVFFNFPKTNNTIASS
ncbi:hypothetical protein Hanom_Chr02g00102951 [Helianthus anomalus]